MTGQLRDGARDTSAPRFDKGGKYPWFLARTDLKKRKTEPFADRIDAASWGTFLVSNDRKKVLFAKDRKWFLVGADDAPKAGDGVMKGAGDLEVWGDPHAEWRQLYHERARLPLRPRRPRARSRGRGEALRALARRHCGTRRPERLAHRGLSNLVLGHVRSSGGTAPRQGHVGVGLLGADFTVEEGPYRFARILRGENWNPKVRAPLTEPSVDVKEGDFLLAVNGSSGSAATRASSTAAA